FFSTTPGYVVSGLLGVAGTAAVGGISYIGVKIKQSKSRHPYPFASAVRDELELTYNDFSGETEQEYVNAIQTGLLAELANSGINFAGLSADVIRGHPDFVFVVQALRGKL